MQLRSNYFKFFSLTGILFLFLVSCSKKDQSAPSSESGFQYFSLIPGSDDTKIDFYNHRISVRVPDTCISGSGLIASYKISPGANLTIAGIPQQSGITKNNFEQDLTYTVTAADQNTRTNWMVQATNNDNSIPWGLGHFVSRSFSENRSYNWYIDQATSGDFAPVNCGPASVTMAIRWADPGFTKTAQDARGTFRTDGGWWFTSDIDAYLNMYSITHAIIGLSANADSTQAILTHQLDHNQIIILCLDMNHVRNASDKDFHTDKFYQTSPNWGHFIVLKGYQKVDEELFFESYDPFSFGLKNTDHTLKGMNRYYRYEDLSAACLPWWNFAFVIAKKGEALDLDAVRRTLNPLHIPVARSSKN
jgi:hypothetical protein